MIKGLRFYRESVLAAMADSTTRPVVFENEGPDHARIVLDVMMESSSRHLDILAGRMDTCWSADKLRAFLDRSDSETRIILDDCEVGSVPDASVLSKLQKHPRLTIRWLPNPFDHHFCVADGRHVRVEYDRETRKASITFGDPQSSGQRVCRLFNSLWMIAVSN
jgi:hypothetical protein